MKAGNFIEMLKEGDYEETNIKAYQRLIDKLMYLSYGTRPDITFIVRQLSKQNSNPRIGHFKAAKKVLQYLKSTMHLGITYKANEITPSPYGLRRYTNSNYAGDPKDCKLVMRYCFFINGAVISWCSKKQ